MRQPRLEGASKLERKFSNEFKGQHSENLREVDEFHRSSMQAKVRYLPPHRREGDSLENIVGEKPNTARAIAHQRIFPLTNPITQPRTYEGGFSFTRGPGGGGGGIMQPPVGVNGNRGQQVQQVP